jgi:uncharacterized protein
MKTIIKVGFLALLLSLQVADPCFAGPIEDADAATKKGDYATALKLLRPLAERGDPAAQTNLGAMYLGGQGVPQDYATALTWYRKAADKAIQGLKTSSERCTPKAGLYRRTMQRL